MRIKHILAAVALCVLATMVLAQEPAESKAKGAVTASSPVFVPAADLKWADLDPKGAPGVKSADVWGDHTKGAFGGFTRFPAGFVAPLHTHTSAMKIVIISGTFISTPKGKPEVRLGPGSYLMQPGGSYEHTSACDKASDCVFFIQSNGKFDIIPAEAKK